MADVAGCSSHGHWGRADSLGDCSESCGISLTDVSPCVLPMLLSTVLGHLRLGMTQNTWPRLFMCWITLTPLKGFFLSVEPPEVP